MGWRYPDMYGGTNTNITVINERTNETITDANFKIGGLTGQIAELEVKLEAMYRVMLEQGIDPELFEKKIEEIMSEKQINRPALLPTKPCPKCGKTVKKNANTPLYGRCLYCSTLVPFYPTFKKEEEGEDKMDGVDGNDQI